MRTRFVIYVLYDHGDASMDSQYTIDPKALHICLMVFIYENHQKITSCSHPFSGYWVGQMLFFHAPWLDRKSMVRPGQLRLPWIVTGDDVWSFPSTVRSCHVKQ